MRDVKPEEQGKTRIPKLGIRDLTADSVVVQNVTIKRDPDKWSVSDWMTFWNKVPDMDFKGRKDF
jgi:hypothetical protein